MLEGVWKKKKSVFFIKSNNLKYIQNPELGKIILNLRPFTHFFLLFAFLLISRLGGMIL
jgi:hypothetical protein